MVWSSNVLTGTAAAKPAVPGLDPAPAADADATAPPTKVGLAGEPRRCGCMCAAAPWPERPSCGCCALQEYEEEGGPPWSAEAGGLGPRCEGPAPPQGGGDGGYGAAAAEDDGGA